MNNWHAVKVVDKNEDQVGFSHRVDAAKLAPVMDNLGEMVQTKIVRTLSDVDHSWYVDLEVEILVEDGVDEHILDEMLKGL